MDNKPVNKIETITNTLKVADFNTPIQLKILDENNELIDLTDNITHFFITKDDYKYYEVTEFSFENKILYFKMPNVRKGRYKIEIKDGQGSIYPAENNIYIDLIQSFDGHKESAYTTIKEDIINSVKPIVIEHIESNREFYRGEKGKDGLNGRDGEDGRDGIDGKDGKKGEKGDKGDKGDKGEKGEIGDPGQIGSTYLPKFRLDENSNLYYYALPNVIKNGLVLWYDFAGKTNSDPNRTIAEDLSGNGNHGTLQNFNFTAESGYDKNKLIFDGVDDYIRSNKLETLTDFSVELVFQRNSAGISTIAYLTTEANTRGYGMVIQTNRIRYWSDPNDAQSGVNIKQFTTNLDKQHVIITFEKGELKVYRNGKLGTSETIDFPSNLTGFAIGRYDNVLTSPLLSGIFQSAKIYNRPLTPEEIAHNYAIEKERYGIE